MDITIRHAAPGEYAALGDITAHAYLDDGLLVFEGSDEYLDELREVAKRAAAAKTLVAVADGRMLGGVTFVPAPGPMADIAREGESGIRMPAIAPQARGRGAGGALVRVCVERAEAVGDGCIRLVLSTQPTMRAAHRNYERLAFTRTPARDWNPLPDVGDLALLTYELTL